MSKYPPRKRGLAIAAIVLVATVIVVILGFIGNTHYYKNSTIAPRSDATYSGVAPQAVVERAAKASTTEQGVRIPTSTSEKTGKTKKPSKPKSAKPKSAKPNSKKASAGLNERDAKNADTRPLETSSYAPVFQMLWSPTDYDGWLNQQSLDLLEIDIAEANAIRNALIKFKNKYTDYMATQSRLRGESDTSATFIIEPYGETARVINQEFLNDIKNQVSEGTYNLMIEGVSEFAQCFGYGLAWSRDHQDYGNHYQEVTITKISDTDRFRVAVTSRDADGNRVGYRAVSPLTREGVTNFCGQMITNNNSNILK